MAAASPKTALVVGGGFAGLAAAQVLTEQGLEVLLVEQGRGLGGRMCTRTATVPGTGERLTFDHDKGKELLVGCPTNSATELLPERDVLHIEAHRWNNAYPLNPRPPVPPPPGSRAAELGPGVLGLGPGGPGLGGFYMLRADMALAACGDWAKGPRAGDAYVSGWEAAHALLASVVDLLSALMFAAARLTPSDDSRLLAAALVRGDHFAVLARYCASVATGAEPDGDNACGSSGSADSGAGGSGAGLSGTGLNDMDFDELCASTRRYRPEQVIDVDSAARQAACAAEVRGLVSGPGLRALLFAVLTSGQPNGGDAAVGGPAASMRICWPEKAVTASDLTVKEAQSITLQVAARVFQATVSGKHGALPVAQPPLGYVNTGLLGCWLDEGQQSPLPQPQQPQSQNLQQGQGKEGGQQQTSGEQRVRTAEINAAVAVHFVAAAHATARVTQHGTDVGGGFVAVSKTHWARAAPSLRLLVRLLPEMSTRQAVGHLPGLWRRLVAALPRLLEAEVIENDAMGLLADAGLLLRLHFDRRGQPLAMPPQQGLAAAGAAAGAAAAPPPGTGPGFSLRLALEAGLLPALERLLRAAFVERPAAATAAVLAGGKGRTRQEALEENARIATCAVGCLLQTSGVFPALLAHAPVEELVPLLATLARVQRQLVAVGDALLLHWKPSFQTIVPAHDIACEKPLGPGRGAGAGSGNGSQAGGAGGVAGADSETVAVKALWMETIVDEWRSRVAGTLLGMQRFRHPTARELLASTATALLDMVEQDILCAALLRPEQPAAAKSPAAGAASDGVASAAPLPFVLVSAAVRAVLYEFGGLGQRPVMVEQLREAEAAAGRLLPSAIDQYAARAVAEVEAADLQQRQRHRESVGDELGGLAAKLGPERVACAVLAEAAERRQVAVAAGARTADAPDVRVGGLPVPRSLVCYNPGCSSLEGPSSLVAPGCGKTCVRCMAVTYCCGACQLAHWGDAAGGHSRVCPKLVALLAP
eukprot:XP_001702565.1 predicted protein [Chlamydomonas reinhardtii]